MTGKRLKSKIKDEISFTIEDDLFFSYVPGYEPKTFDEILGKIRKNFGQQEVFSKNEIRKSLEKLALAGYVKKTSNNGSAYAKDTFFQKTALGLKLYELIGRVSLGDEVTLLRKKGEIKIIGEYSELIRRGGLIGVFDDNGFSIGPIAQPYHISIQTKRKTS